MNGMWPGGVARDVVVCYGMDFYESVAEFCNFNLSKLKSHVSVGGFESRTIICTEACAEACAIQWFVQYICAIHMCGIYKYIKYMVDMSTILCHWIISRDLSHSRRACFPFPAIRCPSM